MRAEGYLIEDERAETNHVPAREIPRFLEAASISWGSEQQVRAGQEGELLHLELGFSEPETCKHGDWRRHSQHWAFMASCTGVIWVVTHAVEVDVGLSPRPARWSASACVAGINRGPGNRWNLRRLYLIFNYLSLSPQKKFILFDLS